MTTNTRDYQDQLAELLRRLIETLRRKGGGTWQALVRLVSGKTIAIALDQTLLQIKAEGGDHLQLNFEYTVSREAIHFQINAETLRKIVAGQLTVDKAVAEGQIYARHELDEFLSTYELIMRILADSAINPELQALWKEFDQTWPRCDTENLSSSLTNQKPTYDYFIKNVPEDVLTIEIEPYLADHLY
jgi:hypothetical protein